MRHPALTLATVDGTLVAPQAARPAPRRRVKSPTPNHETALWSARAASCSAQHVLLAVESLKDLCGRPLDAIVVAGLAIMLEREARAAASYAENAVTVLERCSDG